MLDTIIGSTPVVMTVVATVLAGLSSSEMTRAQYFKSMAAQTQSKAGDQWNFFQAKKIRGGGLENTSQLLEGLGGAEHVGPASISDAAKGIPGRLLETQREAQSLLAKIQQSKAALGAAADPLERAARKFLPAGDKTEKAETAAAPTTQDRAEGLAKDAAGGGGTTKKTDAPKAEKPATAEGLAKEIDSFFSSAENAEAMKYLASGVPAIVAEPLGYGPAEDLMGDVLARKTEAETREKVARVTDEGMERAIRVSEHNAAQFDAAAKPVGNALGELARRVGRQAAMAHAFQRAAREMSAAMAEVAARTPATSPAPSPDAMGAALGPAVAAFSARVASLAGEADALRNGVNVARMGFTARRYARDSEFNQITALLLEVQVRQNDLLADRHRDRSKEFFYGMLVAQAGVTIATLSLALKQKSIMWAIAAVAGTGAILFGLYVYVFT